MHLVGLCTYYKTTDLNEVVCEDVKWVEITYDIFEELVFVEPMTCTMVL